MGKILDYAPPPVSKGSFGPLIWALLIAALLHLVAFGLFGAALDGGRRARMCAVISLCYWLVVVIMVASRRRSRVTQFDLAYIAFAYPVILLPNILVVTGAP